MSELKFNVAEQLSKFELSPNDFLAIVKNAVSPDIKAQGCTLKTATYIVKSESGGHGMGSYTTHVCEGVSIKYSLELSLANIPQKSEMTGELILKSKDLLDAFKKLIISKVPGLANKKAEIDFQVQNTSDDRFGGTNYEVTKVTIRFG